MKSTISVAKKVPFLLEHSKSRGDTEGFSSCSLAGENMAVVVGMGLTPLGGPSYPRGWVGTRDPWAQGWYLLLLAYWDLPPRATQNSAGSCPSAITGFSILEMMSATILPISRSSPLQPCQASTAASAPASAEEEEEEVGTFLLGVAAPTLVPGGTHLPIPEVAAAGGLEHKDIIGVEGRGAGRHFVGFGVVLIGAMHVEEAGGGCRLVAARPRGTTLGGQGQEVTTSDTGSPTCPLPSPQLPCTHSVHHHLALEDGHQVGRLLAHGDPNLHRLIVILLVQDDGLVGRGGQLICGGLATLGRAEGGSAPITDPFFSLLGRGNPHAIPIGSCRARAPLVQGGAPVPHLCVSDLGGLTCQR